MASTDELINQQIGEYRIVERIGGGGMSEGVYHAKHIKLESDVAIKVMDIGAGLTEDRRKRVLEEPRRTARLNHPNIIKVYDVIDQGPRLYMVMEYVSGGDLASRLEEHRAKELAKQTSKSNEFVPTPMPDQFTATVIRQVGRALDYAHNQGLVHRDIKPKNILLSTDGHVVITDFGIAKAMTATELSITREGVGVGTPPYMSPEQVRGDDLTPASDVYSLAIMAYQMLTGRLPFEGESSVVVAQKHINQPPPPPRQVNPKISRQVETLILKALAKKPAERYNRAGDFATQLAEALVGSSASLEMPTLTFRQRFEESRFWGFVGGFGRFVGRLASGVVTTLLRSIVYIIVGLALFFALLLGGGAYLGARFVENVVADYNWQFNEAAVQGNKTFNTQEIQAGLERNAQLYFPGSIEKPIITLRPPDGIGVAATLLGQPITLEGKIAVASGYPVFTFTTLNGQNASVFGSLLAGGINRGFTRALDNSNAKMVGMTMNETTLTFSVEGGKTVAAPISKTALPEGVLLRDDFSDLNSGWPRAYSYEAAHLMYEGGRYRIDVRQPNLLVLQDIASGLREFDISVDVILSEGSKATTFGLALMEKDQNNYLAVLLAGDGFGGVEAIVDGKPQMLLEWKLIPNFNKGSKPDTLRARVTGGKISFIVNSQEVGSADIPESLKAGGRVGFIVRSGQTGNVTVFFDNLEAKKP